MFAAVAAVSLSLPGSAVAMSTGGKLSPRLAELAKPSVRSAPRAEQAARLSVSREGPGSLVRSGNRVLVDARFDHGAATRLAALRAAGAEIVHVSRRFQTVTAAVRPAQLRAVARVAGVDAVAEVLAPFVAATGCSGLVTSEGDGQLNASDARQVFNVDGAGVKVGILSDSFDTDPFAVTHAGEDVASGDLPGSGNPCGRTTPVSVLEDFSEPGETADEGRAMAQIVHDLAPGASLSFATAFVNEFSFAENILALAAGGSDVIVDDIFYLTEPFFQDGPIAAVVNEVTANGAAYFSAAGNDNLIDAEGHEIASWEAPAFRDSGSCPASLLALPEFGPGHCMDFDPGAGEPDDTFGITVEKDATLTVDLQWAEPWFGVKTDLDAFLLDATDEPVEVEGFLVGSAENNISGIEGSSEVPVELFQWENDTGEDAEVQLAINRCFGPCNPDANEETTPRLKIALLQNGSGVSETEYPESAKGDVVGPTIFGHSGAQGAVGVGAVPFNDSSEPEEFSSRGPVTHYFGPVTSTTPAGEQEETISKPDLAASDCVETTFFGSEPISGIHLFCGTSAAAPHAAAVAALMREANPSATLAQLRTALATTARPVGAFGPEAVGAGLVDAYAAVSRVALPPEIEITEPPPALTNDPAPSIGFSANRPVTFTCSLDAGPLLPCASPFVPSTPLVDGTHGFVVSGIDAAGRSGTSEQATFTVDTRPPNTFFRAHPRRKIRTARRRVRAAFRFGSNEKGSDFICRVDGGLFRFCPERFARRFRPGRHVVRVKARDPAGNLDRSPAVYRFRVKLRRRAR